MGLKEADVTPKEQPAKSLSIVQGFWAGAAAFIAGGAIVGTFHFVGTAKSLEEEGISKAQRLKALPTAAKALTVSSAICCLFGIAGYCAFTLSGVQMKKTAEVSSLHDAITLAEDQREMIRHEFQKRLGVWHEEVNTEEKS